MICYYFMTHNFFLLLNKKLQNYVNELRSDFVFFNFKIKFLKKIINNCAFERQNIIFQTRHYKSILKFLILH